MKIRKYATPVVKGLNVKGAEMISEIIRNALRTGGAYPTEIPKYRIIFIFSYFHQKS